MTRVSLSIILSFALTSTYAQFVGTLYYDSEWKITTRQQSAFFRSCILDTTKLSFYGDVKDYYRNGKLQMTGKYENNIKIDSFHFYYPNGKLESKGLYVNDARAGTWKYYYRNGQLRQVIEILETDFTVKSYYDSLGNPILVNGTGTWNNEYKLPGMFMWIRIQGEYKDNNRHNDWKVFTHHRQSDEKLEYKTRFKDGVLKSPWYSGTFLSVYLADHFKFKMTEEFRHSDYVTKKNYPFIRTLPAAIDSLELPYDTYAAYPGGDRELQKFIDKNLVYPAQARKEGIERSTYAEFIIDKQGYIVDIAVREHDLGNGSTGYGFREEVGKVLRLMPKWTTATRNGQPVAQRMHLSIRFNVKAFEIQRSDPGHRRAEYRNYRNSMDQAEPESLIKH